MEGEIVEKELLAKGIKKIVVRAPEIVKAIKPGQFLILRIDEKGERIPLTIADYSKSSKTVTLIFQEVGRTTKRLGRLNKGDKILNLAGPLGKPTEVRYFGKVVIIGGGVGTAVVYPICIALKRAKNHLTTIIGARTSSLLILERELKKISDSLYISTDDGTKGKKGFVSEILKELIEKGKRIDYVVCAGPVMMMKAISEITKPYKIKTTASLNPIMVDGTGMCGSCRVKVGERTYFACVDGPEFDASLVDFDELATRLSLFTPQEKI